MKTLRLETHSVLILLLKIVYLVGGVKITPDATNKSKHKYSGYGICFDSKGKFSISNITDGRNVIIFGADMSFSAHERIRLNNIYVLNIKERIKDWCGYFFTEMVNINDTNSEFLVSDFKDSKDGLILFNIANCSEDSVSQIVFNNIECIFRKSGIYSYLIFCENDEKESLLNRYVEIMDKIKEEILFLTDEPL